MRFGVEIEMVSRSRPEIARAVHKAIGGNQIKHVVDQEDETITHEEVYAQDGSIWKVEDDDSLDALEHLRAELVSPVLQEEHIEALKSIVSAVAKTGAQTNPSCGVHVHIDATRASVEDICRLIDVMIEEEPALVKEFGCTQNRLEHFAKLLSEDFVARFRAQRPTTREELARLWYGEQSGSSRQMDRHDESRYHGLNLQSFFFRGTVEFRYFDGSLDPNQIEAYVRRCIDIAKRARMP